MIKPFIKIQYPPSKKVFRSFKASDFISYSGRICLFDSESFDRYRLYESLEGTPLFNLSHELVLLKDKELFVPTVVEYLFLRGVVATIGLPIVREDLIEMYKKFSRVHLSPLVSDEKLSMMNERGRFMEVRNMKLYVNISANGLRYEMPQKG
ncbi:hypothetical protein [Kosmotoga pacifica]|uniref:Uncharacterized protein n=1 Tax=Kosmotoga pacifica TaxID=1330330 RepID=A0A0G2ZAS2_9BACT|nr:hypothetical protein [Kosmotoga pacifica]AKI97196.1 hypothetical protein IX53_04520 [Kosmotoga pacifica]